MNTKIADAIAPYGWTVADNNGCYELSNRLGKMVCTISVKNGKYKFADTGGGIIISGNRDVADAAVIVITGYFFARLVNSSNLSGSAQEQQ